MERLNLAWVVSVISGTYQKDTDFEIKAVSTDSRTAGPGELFFALKGDRFDGHSFIRNVTAKGAWAVASRSSGISGEQIINVDDPMDALTRLSAAYRQKYRIPIIAVTGSHGKTTTKDMIASILETRYKVLKTYQNLNGVIGVPLMLMQLDPSMDIAVIEVGISMPGEMARLASAVNPDTVIFTCAAMTHTEFLHSIGSIVEEKSIIFKYMSQHGNILLNADDANIRHLQPPGRIIHFGLTGGDFRGEIIGMTAAGMSMKTKGPGLKERIFQIPVPGRHNASNALAAIACSSIHGVGPDDIQRGFDHLVLSPHRSKMIRTGDVVVIDDTYNAAPASMISAIELLVELPGNTRRIIVLGDMLELGDHSVLGHLKVVESCQRPEIDRIFLFGPMMKAALESSRASEGILWFPDAVKLTEALLGIVRPGDAVLIKASHGMKADQIVSWLVTRLEACQGRSQ